MTHEHAPNCRTSKWGYSLDTLRNDPECTCGLYYRILLETEKSMHQAWRKRAEEAELREQEMLAHIREQEVYVMAGKLFEQFPEELYISYNRWTRMFAWSCVHKTDRIGFTTWESAVRDAYKTLLEEATE